MNEVPANLYRKTSSTTNGALKRSRLSDTNTDNTKRKAAILIILKSEDLLILITKVRSKPIKTPSNPNGYSPKRCITNIRGEEETINSNDEYLNRHDINLLYLAMMICISNEIQYLCPVATATTRGITLWAFSNCDKQRYYLDLAKSRGRIGSIASQQCLYQLSILCK